MGTFQLKRMPKLRFSQRFARMMLFWGVPMVFLELIYIPRDLWGDALFIVLPLTLVAVLTGTALEHWFITYKKKE
jgi:hypothetical protein